MAPPAEPLESPPMASDLTPPYGYDTIVPLRNDHRILRDMPIPPKIRALNSVPIVTAEIEAAAHSMPVVFAPLGDPAAPSGFMTVGVMGLVETENVFIDADGRWVGDAYLPAYVRRMPFTTAAAGVAENGEPRRMMCVEQRVLSDDIDATLPVAEDGQPTAAWTRAEQFTLQYERELELTDQAMKLLFDLKLIEGFVLKATPAEGQELQFSGIGRINEAALEALTAQQLRTLFDRKLMRVIYAHLFSLDRFPALVHRRTAITGDPATPVSHGAAAG